VWLELMLLGFVEVAVAVPGSLRTSLAVESLLLCNSMSQINGI
jgi:hypothetical protein